jgi:hypothetical protein
VLAALLSDLLLSDLLLSVLELSLLAEEVDESAEPPFDDDSAAFGADFDDEYRSEYQPPPLRIKLVPPLMRR